MQPREWPRKVHVFASKSPGDDDTDKSLIFFKKYVKVGAFRTTKWATMSSEVIN